MRYMRSIQFIGDRKNWLMNLLWAGIAMLVPIVGPLVLDGWLYEVIESLHNDPEHKDYQDFDLNRLTEYLTRGIWPFLVDLIMQAIMMVPMFLAFIVFFAIVIGASQAKAPALIVVGYLFLFAVIFAVAIVMTFISWPATFYAGLNRGFNFSGIVAFVKDFNKRVFRELLLSILFFFVAVFVAEMVGFALLCVGLLFTMAAVVMAGHHLQFQLYELYLQRGGTPIPVSSGSSPPPARVEPVGDEPDERFRSTP
ncbi:MAG: DUF4013 domain-containing protein [Gemmataceae bacterium]